MTHRRWIALARHCHRRASWELTVEEPPLSVKDEAALEAYAPPV